jgi:hypothetical protein
MIFFRIRTENHFLELEESTFFISRLLSSFQRITSQNQARIIASDSTMFVIAPLILAENQVLRAVPNGA